MTHERLPEQPPMPVSDSLRELLLALADGWTPSAMSLPTIGAIRLDGQDLSAVDSKIDVRRHRLCVEFSGTGVRIDELTSVPFSRELVGTLVGGATFRASRIVHARRSGSVTHGYATSHVSLDFEDWMIAIDVAPPSLWIGQVEGNLNLALGGNLIVDRVAVDGFSVRWRGHFCMAGAYTYYLVQSTAEQARSWQILIDTHGVGAPQPEVIGNDFLVLQFVLGRQLKIPELLGVTGDLRTCAWSSGVGTRSILSANQAPPVPLERDNDSWVDECWASRFFECLSAFFRSRPDSRSLLWLALDGYLDAMTFHLDADYLRLHVVLEATAYWMLRSRQGGEPDIVKDKVTWKKWAKENETAIRAMAKEGYESSLYNKVIGAYRLASGRVVPTAFQMHQLAVTAEMVEELDKRDIVVHQGMISPEGYDVARDLRRIAVVRTMLVALLAKAAGYNGAINGWEVGRLGQPEQPTGWWVVADDDRRRAHAAIAQQ